MGRCFADENQRRQRRAAADSRVGAVKAITLSNHEPEFCNNKHAYSNEPLPLLCVLANSKFRTDAGRKNRSKAWLSALTCRWRGRTTTAGSQVFIHQAEKCVVVVLLQNSERLMLPLINSTPFGYPE